MSRHAQLKAQWAPGQIWETRIENSEQWVLVGDQGRAEPVWEERQEYRQREQPAQQWKSGDEFLPYHPDASHVDPQFRDGWNACYRAATAQGAVR